MSAAHSWIVIYSHSLGKGASEMTVIWCVQRYSSLFPRLSPASAAPLSLSLFIPIVSGGLVSDVIIITEHSITWIGQCHFRDTKYSPYWKIIFISWESLWEAMDSADSVHTDFLPLLPYLLITCHSVLGTAVISPRYYDKIVSTTVASRMISDSGHMYIEL